MHFKTLSELMLITLEQKGIPHYTFKIRSHIRAAWQISMFLVFNPVTLNSPSPSMNMMHPPCSCLNEHVILACSLTSENQRGRHSASHFFLSILLSLFCSQWLHYLLCGLAAQETFLSLSSFLILTHSNDLLQQLSPSLGVRVPVFLQEVSAWFALTTATSVSPCSSHVFCSFQQIQGPQLKPACFIYQNKKLFSVLIQR